MRSRTTALVAVAALVGGLLLSTPARGATAPVGSAAGDAWSDTTPAAGTAVLTYGHDGCTAVDIDGVCTGGSWPTIAGADWIWTTQMVTDTQAVDGTLPTTFSKTVTGPNCPAGSITATIKIAADDSYDLNFNGDPVGSGGMTPISYQVPAFAGSNELSVTVIGGAAVSGTPTDNPAGVAYAVTFSCSVSAKRIVATSASEYAGAASAGVVAWTVWTGRRNVAYATPTGGTRVKLNATGTEGWVHSVDGSRVIYQQYSHKTGVSDVYIYNTKTRKRSRVGPVSSKAWEYHPGISGSHIAFDRWFPSSERKLYVYDTTTGNMKVIARTSGDRRGLSLGQINGRWVVYEIYTQDRDSYTSWNVYRYDMVTNTTMKIPNPGPKSQFGPSVSASGIVFYGRGPLTCGGSSVYAFIGGSAVAMLRLPSTKDFGYSFVRDGDNGRVDVFFDPGPCTGQTDIMTIGVVPGVSSAAAATGVSMPSTATERGTAAIPRTVDRSTDPVA